LVRSGRAGGHATGPVAFDLCFCIKVIMSFYSIAPFFGCMILLIALASTPMLASADAPPSSLPQRVVTLDGLRGFLAFAVFFHHSSIYHRFLLGGPWELPP
jgi:hypothetical protein